MVWALGCRDGTDCGPVHESGKVSVHNNTARCAAWPRLPFGRARNRFYQAGFAHEMRHGRTGMNMSSFKRWLYAAVLGLVLVGPAPAADVEGLYEARVPVESQNAEARSKAVGEALVEVLIKLTGQQDVGANPALQDALQGATRYVQQFRYVAAEPPAVGQQLAVRFDPAALSELLSKEKLPLWGRARPATLLWLAVEQRGRRELIGANSDDRLREAVMSQAQRRGLPVRLPLLDLTDRGNLSASDVWGGFEGTIKQASARYETEAVLVGRVYAGRGGRWQGRWSLLQEGAQREHWEADGDSVEAAVNSGLDRAVELLARRFAQGFEAGREEGLLVEVQDVKGLEAYARAMTHLESLSPVHSVRPAALGRSAVTFRLDIRGGREAVLQAMRLGRTVVPVETARLGNELETVPPAEPGISGYESPEEVALTPDLVVRLLP